MRFEGTLTSWNDERGFGFIRPAQGGDDIFAHAKAFPARVGRPQAGQRVTFEIERGPQGRKRARNIALLRAPAPARAAARPVPARWSTASRLAIPAFLVVCIVVGVLWSPPAWTAAAYLGASLAAFVLYAIDKSAARRRQWRVAESTLHLLALAGGWPGALVAQHVFRHKSSKREFREVFWFTVLANVGGFVYLSSPFARG